ncbi:MAG: SPOR domain-containing protein [Magnetococcales bacterium]|nr:SPOR domain-containing protein [Magnetococcales bacterium]
MTSSVFDKVELKKIEKLDSTDLDWSDVNYGNQRSAIWWRIFIWALTIIAIFGIAAALFWWQVNKGVGPSSTLSDIKVVQSDSATLTDLEESFNNQERLVLQDFPKPQTSGQYMVLAGSFINKDNAARIFTKLTQSGIPVRSKEAMVNGQHHTHLLVGPYKKQKWAKLAVSKIREKTNLPVDYISLEVGDELIEGKKIVLFDNLVNTSSLHPDQFVVLAGSFTTIDLAKHVQQRLYKKQISSQIKKAHEQDRVFYHVMVGPYRLAMQANNMVETIRQQTGILAESTQIL